jgi:LPS export ABC transporter protein LptC
LGAIACAVALAACNPQSPNSAAQATPAAATTPTPLSLHITAHGNPRQPVRAIYQIHNRVQYDLAASSAESEGPQGSTRADFTDARITFHAKNGSSMVATAPHAVVDETTDSVTLVDNVRARTSTGMTLQCDRLVYDRSTEMLHGYGNVVIVDPKGFRATGSSFDSDVSLTHMHLI